MTRMLTFTAILAASKTTKHAYDLALASGHLEAAKAIIDAGTLLATALGKLTKPAAEAATS